MASAAAALLRSTEAIAEVALKFAVTPVLAYPLTINQIDKILADLVEDRSKVTPDKRNCAYRLRRMYRIVHSLAATRAHVARDEDPIGYRSSRSCGQTIARNLWMKYSV